MKSADTQDSNVLGGAVPGVARRDDDGSANTLADLPPSYTSKSATLPLDTTAIDEDLALDDDGGWQSPQPPDDEEPVQSIEFAEYSDDDSPLEQSDMVASGSSQLAPVTETAFDDDYDELIHVQPSRAHHDLMHPTDARAHSPFIPSRDPSRHTSPAPSDSSASHHLEHRPGGLPRAHKPPPPPPPRRRIHVEEDIPVAPFDPFESLPPPTDVMMHPEKLDEEDLPAPRDDELDFDDDPASAHPYWPPSKPTDL